MERSDVTPDFIRSILTYSPETGVLTWRVRHDVARRINVRCAGKVAGKINLKNGYRTVVIQGMGFLAHRLAWAHAHGVWPASDLDHIDGDADNNAIANLRLATKCQNQLNRPKQRNNSSGMKGVTWHGEAKKWSSRICINGSRKYLGLFDTKEEAFAAYKSAAAETGFSDRII